MIPRETIEDIKFRCPVEDVIASYVTLKRGGSTMKGLCPFHSEKTPSFTVFPASQDFHCFGCGAGGDVISFVMRMENLEYPDAIRFLAKRCGVNVPEDNTSDTGGVKRSRILEMNLVAAKYFRACLMDEKLGAPGREYLTARGLPQLIVKRFGLGYAPADFKGLYRHLRSKLFSDEEILAGYLGARSAKNGNVYDVFRGRVMFPIIDVSGNVVAFGGRVIDDSQPKYLNSSDTPAFKKSRHLFALNFARLHSAERLILCEGYMDVIALHAAGFENAVATLGTAITPDHARIFKKYTPKCVISYDADEAGQRAADKAFRLLEEAGVDTKILKVYGAKDPDEFIRKYGAKEFAKLLDAGKSRFEFQLDGIRQKYRVEESSEKIKAIAEMTEYIAGVHSSVQREIYAQQLAKEFGVEQSNVQADVERVIKRRIASEKKKRPAELVRKTSGIGDRINPDFAKMPKIARLEETVIGLLLLRKEYVSAVVSGNDLTVEHFATEFGKRLFSFISERQSEGGFDFGMLNEAFSQEEVSRAASMLYERQKLADNGQKVYEESLRLLKEEKQRMDEGSSKDDIISVINRRRAAEK